LLCFKLARGVCKFEPSTHKTRGSSRLRESRVCRALGRGIQRDVALTSCNVLALLLKIPVVVSVCKHEVEYERCVQA
jgi:hypothetical protein